MRGSESGFKNGFATSLKITRALGLNIKQLCNHLYQRSSTHQPTNHINSKSNKQTEDIFPREKAIICESCIRAKTGKAPDVDMQMKRMAGFILTLISWLFDQDKPYKLNQCSI